LVGVPGGEPALVDADLLFGIVQGTIDPPITNTAVSGMPASMAGVATIVGSAASRGGMAFTSAEHGMWWLVLGLGVGILVLGLLSTGRRAQGSARRCSAPLCPTSDGQVRGRSQSDTLVGFMVWSTTPSSSVVSGSRSTYWRSRALNASIVLTASYLRRLNR
jgi:hypothetical protein